MIKVVYVVVLLAAKSVDTGEISWYSECLFSDFSGVLLGSSTLRYLQILQRNIAILFHTIDTLVHRRREDVLSVVCILRIKTVSHSIIHGYMLHCIHCPLVC
jgi:hypothetical protein